MSYIIDVESHDVKRLVRRLKRLTSTIEVYDNGEYIHCQGYSQVFIHSTKTEEEIDNWLSQYSNCDYIGIVTL